jgi:hypothetical protein
MALSEQGQSAGQRRSRRVEGLLLIIRSRRDYSLAPGALTCGGSEHKVNIIPAV